MLIIMHAKHLQFTWYYFEYCDLYDGHLWPSKYGKIQLTTSRLLYTVVTTPIVHQYGRQYLYDGAVHMAHTVYGWQSYGGYCGEYVQ